MSSSTSSGKRVGQPSRYLNGGASLLARAPNKPGDELQGGWTREQLLRMDDCFVVAVEAAFRSGLESPASASACERPGAGIATGYHWRADRRPGPLRARGPG
jgi:hypothetical protein